MSSLFYLEMLFTFGRGILSSEKLARLKLSPCVRFSSIGGVLLFVVLSKCAFLAWGIFRFNVPPEEIFSTRFSLLNEGADELLLWHVLSVVLIFHLKWSFVVVFDQTYLLNFCLIFITGRVSCPSQWLKVPNLFFSNGFLPFGIECPGLWVEKTVREIPFDISWFSNFECWIEYVEKLIQWVFVIAQITTEIFRFKHDTEISTGQMRSNEVKWGQMRLNEVKSMSNKVKWSQVHSNSLS